MDSAVEGYGSAEEPGVWEFDDCVDEMQRRGVAWVPCNSAAMTPLAKLFAALPVDEMFAGKAEEVYTVDGPRGLASVAVASSAVAGSMRWFWACDEATLQLFDSVAEECLSALSSVDGRPMRLYSACFVVVHGEQLTHEEVSRHVDWGHDRIPSGGAFTCLTPLTALPNTIGGLQFWPWDSKTAYGPITSLNMNVPFMLHVHKYQLGRFAAIDGKLFHKTEPFKYERCESQASTCDAFEAAGHLRVLVSLSIASSEPHLARYTRKTLKAMTPVASLIREDASVFIDSESDCGTSDSDSDCEEVLGPQSIRSVLQAGTWIGAKRVHGVWGDVGSFCLELRFNVQRGLVVHAGRAVGTIRSLSGCWVLAIHMAQPDGGGIALAGSLVRSSGSVCIQGHCRGTGVDEDAFCLFQPSPWNVMSARWSQFPLPCPALGLPLEADLLSAAWAVQGGAEEETDYFPARAAKWVPRHTTAPGGAAQLRGRLTALAVDSLDHAVSGLAGGQILVAPEAVLRRGFLEPLLEVAAAAGCVALLVLQAGRPRLLRAARARSGLRLGEPSLPLFIVDAVAGERLLATAGAEGCLRMEFHAQKFGTPLPEGLEALLSEGASIEASAARLCALKESFCWQGRPVS